MSLAVLFAICWIITYQTLII